MTTTCKERKIDWLANYYIKRLYLCCIVGCIFTSQEMFMYIPIVFYVILFCFLKHNLRLKHIKNAQRFDTVMVSLSSEGIKITESR